MFRPTARPLARSAFALAALMSTMLPAAASAEGDPAAVETAPTADAPDPGVRFAPVTHHTFGGEQVDGRTLRPDGDWVNSRRGGTNPSLVRIRTTFYVELLQSADDL